MTWGLDAFNRLERCLFPCANMSRTVKIPEISCGNANVRVQSIALRNNIGSTSVYEGNSAGHRTHLGEGPGQVILGVKMLKFMTRIGLVVNWEKSELEPTQDLTYIGARFLTKIGIVTIPEDRIEAIKTIASTIRRARRVVVRHFLRFLGLLNSCIFQIQCGRLFTRPLQLYLKECWKPSTGHIEDTVPILPSIEGHLLWWEQESNLRRGISLKPQEPQEILGFDASRNGWGAFLESGGETNRQSSKMERMRHINWLEMKAIHNALIYFQERVEGKVMKVKCDNTTVVAYINKQGGLSSMGNVELVQAETDHSSSGIHTGKDECISGSLLATRSPARMVIVPGSSEGDIPDMGDSIHRSVRQLPNEETTNILLGEGSGSIHDGQPIDQLEGNGRVCLPPRTSYLTSITEGQKGREQDDTDSTKLGETTVDVVVDRSISGHSKAVTSKEKVAKASRATNISSQSGDSKLVCMEDKRSDLRKKGFLRKAAELATSYIRPTTCRTYGYKIQKFISWCDKERIKHPRSFYVASVCNFLTEVFEGGASAHAISEYISALSKWHSKVHGKYL